MSKALFPLIIETRAPNTSDTEVFGYRKGQEWFNAVTGFKYICTNEVTGTWVASGASATVDWSNVTSKPTTLSGYGITDAQPLDGDLTAIAALTTTSFGRAFLAQTDAASTRSTLAVLSSSEISAAYQPLDADLTAIAALTTTSFGRAFLAQTDAASTRSTLAVLSSSEISAAYQPLDGDLTAIAALAGTSGFLKKTAANTWSLDTATYLTGNQSITLSGDATGSGNTAINVTLANSGVVAGSYNSATALRSITVDAKGRITSVGPATTITPDWSSITSKPTTLSGYGITDAQPLDADLTAIAALSTTGYLKRTGTNTWILDAGISDPDAAKLSVANTFTNNQTVNGYVRINNAFGCIIGSNGGYIGIGAYWSGSSWNRVTADLGGAVIRNTNGQLEIFAGNPATGAVDTAIAGFGRKFFIDGSGNVYIGDGNPASIVSRLTIKQFGDTSNPGIHVERAINDSFIRFGFRTTTDTWEINASYVSTGTYKAISFVTSDSVRFTISTSGEVFVGAALATSGKGLIQIPGGLGMLFSNGGDFTAGVWSRDANWGTFYTPHAGIQADICLADSGGNQTLFLKNNAIGIGVTPASGQGRIQLPPGTTIANGITHGDTYQFRYTVGGIAQMGPAATNIVYAIKRSTGESVVLFAASGGCYVGTDSNHPFYIMSNNQVAMALAADKKFTNYGSGTIDIGNVASTNLFRMRGGAGSYFTIDASQGAGSEWGIGDAVGAANGTLVIYDFTHSRQVFSCDASGNIAIPRPTSFGSTLGVTGATSLSTLSTSGLATLNSASVSTTLGVTGNTTLSTLSTSGLATLNSASVSTTLGVTGNTTLSTLTTTGVATLGGSSAPAANTFSGNKIWGSTNGSDAVAGQIGEIITATNTAGVGLVNAATSTILSITLTAGDWDVSCSASTTMVGTTSYIINLCLSTVSNSTSGAQEGLDLFRYSSALGNSIGAVMPVLRVKITATTTYYLVAFYNSSGSCTAYPRMFARRIR